MKKVKRRIDKNRRVVKGMPSAVLLSAAIHAAHVLKMDLRNQKE